MSLDRQLRHIEKQGRLRDIPPHHAHRYRRRLRNNRHQGLQADLGGLSCVDYGSVDPGELVGLEVVVGLPGRASGPIPHRHRFRLSRDAAGQRTRRSYRYGARHYGQGAELKTAVPRLNGSRARLVHRCEFPVPKGLLSFYPSRSRWLTSTWMASKQGLALRTLYDVGRGLTSVDTMREAGLRDGQIPPRLVWIPLPSIDASELEHDAQLALSDLGGGACCEVFPEERPYDLGWKRNLAALWGTRSMAAATSNDAYKGLAITPTLNPSMLQRMRATLGLEERSGRL